MGAVHRLHSDHVHIGLLMVKHLLLPLYSQLDFSSLPLGKFSMKWQILQRNMKAAKLGSLLGVPLEAFTEDAFHCHASCAASTWRTVFVSCRFIAGLCLLPHTEQLQLSAKSWQALRPQSSPLHTGQGSSHHPPSPFHKQSYNFNLKLVHSWKLQTVKVLQSVSSLSRKKCIIAKCCFYSTK